MEDILILAIDIGNTNIVVGCIRGDEVLFTERLSTNTTHTTLEYAISFKNVLEIYQIDAKEIEGAIISSVVPPITNVIRDSIHKITDAEVLIVGPGVKTGLNILMDNPKTLGSDLVVNAVAGISEYPVPLILIDLGTATTISVIDNKKNYIGRHDSSGNPCFYRLSDQPHLTAAAYRCGRTPPPDRNQHHRLHEERYDLRKCFLSGWNDPAYQP